MDARTTSETIYDSFGPEVWAEVAEMYQAMPEGEKPTPKEEWKFADHCARYTRWFAARKHNFTDVEFILDSLIPIELFDIDEVSTSDHNAWEYGYLTGYEDLPYCPFWWCIRRDEFSDGYAAGELDRISELPFCLSNELQF